MQKWSAEWLDGVLRSGRTVVVCGSTAGAIGLRRAVVRRAQYKGMQVHTRLRGRRVEISGVPQELTERETTA